MNIPSKTELNIQCILATEVPKIPSGYVGTGQRGNTVILYKLLLSLGLLRWIVTRELKDIYELNESLQVPGNIALFLPSNLERRHSSIADAMRLITTYFSKLNSHPCSADVEFIVFATNRMTILQYFIVEGSPQGNVDGVYVFKKQQGGFSSYEKQDNPNYAIINMIWEGKTGWYLVDEWQVYFYAVGLDQFSEFPPEGVWRALDPGKWWSEHIEVRSGVPTKVDIQKSLRRNLCYSNRPNTSKTKSRRLSLRLRKATTTKHRRHRSLPANVENMKAEMLQAGVKSYNGDKQQHAWARKSVRSSPVDQTLRVQRQEWPEEIFLLEQAPLPKQKKTANPPSWLTTPLPTDLKKVHPENGLNHETSHHSQKDWLRTMKKPLKCNNLKIRIPAWRPLSAGTEVRLESDSENSTEMLSPRKYCRNSPEEDRSSDSNRGSFPSSDKSHSTFWLSYQLHRKDDIASSPSIPISCEVLSSAASNPDQVVCLKKMQEYKEELPYASSIKSFIRPPKASHSVILHEETRMKPNPIGTHHGEDRNHQPRMSSRLTSEVLLELSAPEIDEDRSSGSISVIVYEKDDLISFGYL